MKNIVNGLARRILGASESLDEIRAMNPEAAYLLQEGVLEIQILIEHLSEPHSEG